MPSLNRLLVLAVLSVSVAVQSAPLREAAGTDLSHAIVVTERDVVAASVDDFDEADDDLNVPKFDEVDDDVDDLDDSELDDEEDAHPTLERRVGRKAAPKAKAPVKAAPKVAAPKVAAPKVAAPKAAAPKAAAPKAAAPKAAAPKAAAPKVAAPKAAAPKAAAPKAAAPKAAAPKAKTPPKTAAPFCPAKKTATGTKASTKKPRVFERALDYVESLFKRTAPEFVGWHGTNSDTAEFWAQKGQLEKPVKADGLLDFIGLGPKSTAGTSGADAEIGPGVYVTDDKDIAIAFANNNAKVNPGTTAQLCAIFAKSSSNWRTALRKAFIPENLVGDSSDATRKAALENARLAHVKTAVPGITPSAVVKFSLLNRSTRTGQMVLPASITNQFTAQCFKADGGATAAGTSAFPAFSYDGQTLRTQWNIAAETC